MLRHLCLLLVSAMFVGTGYAQENNTVRPEKEKVHNPYDCAIEVDSLNGDVLVKLVSYSPEAINVDVDLSSYITKKKKATVTTIGGVVMGARKATFQHPQRVRKEAPADKHFSKRHGMKNRRHGMDVQRDSMKINHRHGKDVQRDSMKAHHRDHGKMQQWDGKRHHDMKGKDGKHDNHGNHGNFGKPGGFDKKPFGKVSAKDVTLDESSIRVEPKNTVNLEPYSIVVIRVKR